MSTHPPPATVTPVPPPSAAFFVVMRRMRTPLIVLLLIFTVSVVGLAVIPGDSADGPWRMGLFDAFYFMSYTASTIGYGEIPQAFNTAQRMWVTFSIYLTVIGWAYAIGSLLAAVNDKSLRYARALQRTARQAARMPEPFWVMAGHGQTGERLGHGLDDLGQRFVAVDRDESRIELLDLGSYRSEVPGVVGDARNPDVLTIAGLTNAKCAGVLAITDDEEANLAVTMNAVVLRPDLPVVARASDPTIQRRMREFGGDPTIIDPFDRFGDHLGVALRSPTADRMTGWLTSPPGTPLPPPAAPLGRGRWVVCGYGRFGRQVVRDLRRDGLEVTLIDAVAHPEEPGLVLGNGTEPEVLAAAGIGSAGGFVAGTDNDTTNLSLIVAARAANPAVSVVARQNLPTNHALFEAMAVDVLMVPSTVVAKDAIALVGTPLLWQFLQGVEAHDEEWSQHLLARLTDRCGDRSPDLWPVDVTPVEAPSLARLGVLPALGDLLRDPQDRDRQVGAVPLVLMRDGDAMVTPPDDLPLQWGDRLLMAGTPAAWRALETTVQVDTAAAYVLTGERIPTSWVWRRLSRRR